MSRDLVVVGGGITGLCLGFRLEQLAAGSGLDWTLLEAGSRVGGLIGSTAESGFLYEWGANGFLDNSPPTLELVRQLELESRMLRARDSASRRYVYRAGRLRLVPTSPGSMFSSGILSPPGKLRLLLEPMMRAVRDDAPESVHSFAARRLGREAADVLVDAMISGVFAGDCRSLELQSTFPALAEMEREHGGLLRAMIARKRQASDKKKEASNAAASDAPKRSATLTSFEGGLQTLIDALTSAIEPRIRLQTTVTSISDRGNDGYRVHLLEGPPIDCRSVVLTCPAPQASGIVQEMDPVLADSLGGISAAGLAVVHLGFRSDALGKAPDGFGFLVPRRQGPRILGTLLPSNTFDGRAPDGSLLTTTMIGGAQDAEAVTLEDDRLLKIVREDLRKILGIEVGPSLTRIVRWKQGIPQYTIGHRARRRTIDERLQSFPGLWVVGNSIGGVAINDCVKAAGEAAGSVSRYLAGAPVH